MITCISVLEYCNLNYLIWGIGTPFRYSYAKGVLNKTMLWASNIKRQHHPSYLFPVPIRFCGVRQFWWFRFSTLTLCSCLYLQRYKGGEYIIGWRRICIHSRLVFTENLFFFQVQLHLVVFFSSTLSRLTGQIWRWYAEDWLAKFDGGMWRSKCFYPGLFRFISTDTREAATKKSA